jgi:hypothetical protein
MLSGRMRADMFATGARSLDPLLDYRFRTCLRQIPGRQPFACNPNVLDVARRALAATGAGPAESLYRETLRRERSDPAGIFLWEAVEFDGVSPRLRHYAPIMDFINFDEVAIAAN